ncbi:SulP family inorganic anion transporter [Undibacterium sp. Ji67W]|uniref:SulP family inorganic anion transporter n=1 Tax=Undibacterium sp. Ji67W TaxID=3413042 RepID=UPI003BF42569
MELRWSGLRLQMPTLSVQDVIAGLSIAGLLLPEAVAYSSIGNLPPQAGVLALFAGLLCYGLLGSSRFAIVSATSSSAAVMAAATASMANGDPQHRMALAFGLIILSGIFFVLASLAKIGSVSEFVAKPVLRGFAFALALTITVKQFSKIVDIHSTETNFLYYVADIGSQVARWNINGILVGIVALAMLFSLARFPKIPGGLTTIACGIAAGHFMHLEQYGIHLVGSMQLQLPVPGLPPLKHNEWARLGELALAMVMILYAESYSSIRTYALKHGDQTSANRDLFAFGISNIVSGLFHGMPVGAGYSATSANEAAGAQSKLAGLCAALTVLVMVWTLLPLIELIPEPVLAAIVIHAVSHSLSLNAFKPYMVWRRDVIVVFVAIAGVVILGVLDGLLAAIALSIALMLRRIANANVTVLGRLGSSHDFVSMQKHPEAKSVPGIIIFRPETPMFFANAERITTEIRHGIAAADNSVHSFIVSLEESYDLDSSSLQALADLSKLVANQNRQLIFARLKDQVQDILDQGVASGLMPAYSSGISVDDTVAMADKTANSVMI